MTFTHSLSTGNYGPAKFIVATAVSNGTHTTLASAMAAASAGDTIFLRDSVTENLTITPGVNIAAWTGGSANTPAITGKLSMTGAGTSTISGIELITNSDFVIAVTGSAASILNVNNCYINCTNNTGISHTSSSASSIVFLNNCTGNLGTTGIGVFSGSTAGTFQMGYCGFNNTGNSTTANTCASTGTYTLNYTSIANPITTSNTAAFSGNNLLIVCAAINTTAFTHNSTLGQGALRQSQLLSGTATALSVAASAVIELLHVELDSTNASTISNSGTVQYTIIQAGTTSALTLAGGGTYTKLATQPAILSSAGAWTLLQTQTASSSANITFTSTYITSTYNKYALVMNNVVPATNGVSMNMTVSTDNGSSYLATGYKAVINVFSEAATANAVSSTSLIPLTIITGNTLANTTGVGLMGTLYMLNWTSGSSFPEIHGNCSYLEASAANTLTGLWGGRAPTTSVINNIKIVMSSGNIATGTFSLYGISS